MTPPISERYKDDLWRNIAKDTHNYFYSDIRQFFGKPVTVFNRHQFAQKYPGKKIPYLKGYLVIKDDFYNCPKAVLFGMGCSYKPFTGLLEELEGSGYNVDYGYYK